MFYNWNIILTHGAIIIHKDSQLKQRLGYLGAYVKTIGFYKYAIGIPEVFETEDEMLNMPANFTRIEAIKKECENLGMKFASDIIHVTSKNVDAFSLIPKKIEHFTLIQKKQLYRRLKEEFPLAYVHIEKVAGQGSFIDVDFFFSEGNTEKLEKICKIFKSGIFERRYNWGTEYQVGKYLGKYVVCKTYSEYGSPLIVCLSDYDEVVSVYDAEEIPHPLTELDPLNWKGPFGEEILVTSWNEIWDSS